MEWTEFVINLLPLFGPATQVWPPGGGRAPGWPAGWFATFGAAPGAPLARMRHYGIEAQWFPGMRLVIIEPSGWAGIFVLTDVEALVPPWPWTEGVGDYYTCPSGVTLGDPVASVGNGGCDVAAADVPGRYPCIGIVKDKITSTRALVQSIGLYLPPGGGPVTPQAQYFLDVSGGTGVRVGAPPGAPVCIQRIGFGKSTTEATLQITGHYTIRTA